MSGPGPYAPEQPQRGRNWLWIVLGILVVLLIVCGGICGGCVFVARQAAEQGGQFVLQALEMGQVQAQAQQAIASSDEVTDKIGPITGQGVPEPVGQWTADSPTLTTRFTVNGEKGAATATVSASREAGAWKITSIEVQLGDGTTVTVPPPAEAPPQINFDITPDAN